MSDEQKKRVTGIGGIFVKSNDPEHLRNWYNKHLGFNANQYGATFEWLKVEKPEEKGTTVWSTFKNNSDYFTPSQKEYMINLRVEDLEWLLAELRKEGIEQVGEMQVYDYGKFAHIVDPEGTKIELWEPIDEKL